MNQIKQAFCKDPVLWISGVAALISMIIVPPNRTYMTYLDFRTLFLLFSLMTVVAGFKKTGLLDLIVKKLLSFAGNTRMISALLIGICFFFSMFITNDVSLITFVPLTILLYEKREDSLLIPVIVLQTLAANLGSMLTPLGNPQNLYLFSVSGMSMMDFLKIMGLPCAVSLILLEVSVLWIPIHPLKIEGNSELRLNVRTVLPWGILFIVCLLSVIRLLPCWCSAFLVLGWGCFSDRTILKQVDYSLLLTFCFFFILIGNIKNMEYVQTVLSSLVNGHEFFSGVLLSQCISNVPAAMLLSGFTSQWKPLLLGVNIGGLGTLIASMASLISYKLYGGIQNSKLGRYFGIFTLANLLGLLILCPISLLCLKG